jgi:protein-lysine N-methyltransferase EEF2KMT
VARIPNLNAVVERRISLVEFHTADEVFTTGTMGELTPVVEIDGRRIGTGDRPITRLIQEHFRTLTESGGVIIPGV